MRHRSILILAFCVLFLFVSCTSAVQEGSLSEPVLEEESPSLENDADEEPVGDITLKVLGETITLRDEEIRYELTNHTGEPISVLMIPRLEKQVQGEWAELEILIGGFCGVPDVVQDVRSGRLFFDMYGDQLSPGKYRLSFQKGAHELDENNVLIEPAQDCWISAEFTIEEAPPLNIPDKTGIAMEIPADRIVLREGVGIPYTITSEHKDSVEIYKIPHLERKIQQGWEKVPLKVAFCGNDILSTTVTDTVEYIPLFWFGDSLEAGVYRLSVALYYEEMFSDPLWQERDIWLFEEFELVEHDDEVYIKLESSSVSADDMLRYSVANKDGSEIYYRDHEIERKTESGWEFIGGEYHDQSPFLELYNDPYYKDFQMKTDGFPLHLFEDSLTPGDYRLSVMLIDENEIPLGRIFAKFTVTE